MPLLGYCGKRPWFGITSIAADIETLDSLSEAIRTRMKANEQGVPSRHGGLSSDKLEVDS